MSQILSSRRLAIFLASLLLLLLLASAIRSSQRVPGLRAQTSRPSFTHLPVIRHDPTPSPIPTPSLPSSPYDVLVQITPDGGINASTFNKGSFILRNNSTNDQRITQVQFDLSTAVFPDMVFDPYGQGGDTLAKDLKVDRSGGTNFAGHSYDGPHGGGFDILELNFQSFDPGEEFRFSVDVDPNSIKGVGAPGPNESGSVSGIELIGATVSVSFEDGASLAHQTFRSPGSDSGSETRLRTDLPPSPQVVVISVPPPPTTVSDAHQITRISGPIWQPGVLLLLEGGLFLEGVPGDGFNVKPYDANSVVAIHEYDVNSGPGGIVHTNVMLSRSLPQAGLNHFVAAFDNHYDMKGSNSQSFVLELKP
jgi:hypothetical protein